KATCKVTLCDVNDPNPDTGTQTVEAKGGEYTLPACPFSPANDTLMFDYWEYEDIYGNDLKKQPGEMVLILDDTTICACWTWKPGVAEVIFDAALSEAYQYGMPAGAVSVSLEDGQHVSLVGSGYGNAYWLECGGTKLDAAAELSTSKAYTLVINFRLEDGYLPYFSHQTGQLNCPAFGELETATPVDQDDGSYLVRFSLPSIPGTPISADKVTFTLSGYERGEKVSAITPSISTAGISFVGSGYGPAADDSAYLIYQDSNEAYVYYDPIYSSTAVFEASTNYYLDILFSPGDGTVLPDSFWSDGTLIKEKFVLSGIEEAEVIEATPRSIGYRVRFKLPQLGNDPLGAARIILSGYEAGKEAWDVVVTFSDNLAASRFTPHEDYYTQYWFYDADKVHIAGTDDYQIPENSLGAGVTLKPGDVHSFVTRLYPATGYDMSGMIPSDLVLSTPWGDCQADRGSVKKGPGEFYWATFTLPAIGNTKPSYAVMLDPGIGTGTAFYNMVYHDGVSDTLSYTLPKLSNVAFTAPEGMIFKAWSVNGAEMQPDTKITVTGFTTVTALWEPAPEEISTVNLRIPSVPAAGAVLDTAGNHKFSAAESTPYEVISSVSWSDATEDRDNPTTIHDGDQFQSGKTYRCLLRVKLKDSRDSFPDSADDITVTLEGVADGYTVENVNIVGRTILGCRIYFTCPPISGSIVKNGSSAHAVLTVDPLSDAEALLIVARYSGGQMLEAHSLPVTESGTFTTDPFAHTAGSTYRAFLVEKGSCLPQWTALNLTE
ncbi:MAG: hypothetical protein IKM31_10680, partial [Oscillospiraceae bacterium]|nr:hypothetical protein [Oscillospiraceae bacterium]